MINVTTVDCRQRRLECAKYCCLSEVLGVDVESEFGLLILHASNFQR